MSALSQGEALSLFEDLKEIKALRENRVWKHHIVPEIERLMAEARSGMRDKKLPSAERCEHVAAWEQGQLLIEFLDKAEAKIRKQLKAHDDGCGIIERPFS